MDEHRHMFRRDVKIQLLVLILSRIFQSAAAPGGTSSNAQPSLMLQRYKPFFTTLSMLTEQIKTYLQELIGLTLTHTTRAADMECIKFGPSFDANNVASNKITLFALHLQSPWRFTSDSKILIGSIDLFEAIDQHSEYDEDFVWDKPNGNLRDFKLQELIRLCLVVTSVIADSFGGFDLIFNDNIKLTLFPTYSKIDNYSEYWRLIDNRSTSSKHVVVSSSGVRLDQDGL